ncbi:TonB family protein [Sphingomicrobium aestuariivivum]|uniref:TonB family protein n=1 Tax=Sphingomicrobium aestuariivivum TaxID=1582356 RepID=UPI001FD68C70|nr:TonB family protein [Sphingomicrobium aestuariivivum]MCJ8191591.1 energy transducer TonB [Sphingomicrobium aestuariivivum]
MYAEEKSWKGRAGTVGVVVGVHALAIAALLTAGGIEVLVEEQPDLTTYDIELEPPPPIIEDIPEPKQATPREEGEASAKQVESKATEIERPEVTPPIPVPPPVVASPKAGEGDDATQGASDRDEGGSGAGGVGDGTGSGGQGDGLGGGGGTRPSVIPRTTLTQRDYPRELRRRWPRGGAVLVAVRVQTDGRATDCKVNRSIGDPEIDAMTCQLVEQKVRFNPARDAQGRPYVAWYGYMQRWVGG